MHNPSVSLAKCPWKRSQISSVSWKVGVSGQSFRFRSDWQSFQWSFESGLRNRRLWALCFELQVLHRVSRDCNELG